MREEYDLDALEIKKLGSGWKKHSKKMWAVCVMKSAESVPLKLYKIEIYPNLSKAKAIAENGEEIYCPADWFLPVKFEKKAANIFEKVAV